MEINIYNEIYVLKRKLEEAQIPFYFEEGFLNGCRIAYPSYKNVVCSAIEHDGSYGRNNDTIEIMGLLEEEEEYDCVLGYLTAENVFERIEKHYKLNEEIK